MWTSVYPKKLRSAKMLSHKPKMSHKHKTSSLWHWKKNLKSQHSIFIANDSFHLLAFAARISMFSVSTNRLFQLCRFQRFLFTPQVGGMEEPPFWRTCMQTTHGHHRVLALCSNKKRSCSYEKAWCASVQLFQSLLPPELNVNRHWWLY